MVSATMYHLELAGHSELSGSVLPTIIHIHFLTTDSSFGDFCNHHTALICFLSWGKTVLSTMHLFKV